MEKNKKGIYYLTLFFQGFCIGIANAIPGISGGTIAFIFGIYEELIDAIKSFNIKFIQLLIKLKIKDAFSLVSWRFLGMLILGAICAILSLSHLITWLLKNKPMLINSFFFGLILATVPIIGKVIKQWTPTKIAAVILSAVLSYIICGMVPVSTPENIWFLFFSGAISISSMILPGISGAFILVLLGKYRFILETISSPFTSQHFISLLSFGMGVLFGIVTFVRILSWLFHKYHDMTVAVLTGIVIGSLNKIWPWKKITAVIETHHGKIIPIEQINIIPSHFNSEIFWAFAWMLIGFSLAILLARLHPSEDKRFAR